MTAKENGAPHLRTNSKKPRKAPPLAGATFKKCRKEKSSRDPQRPNAIYAGFNNGCSPPNMHCPNIYRKTWQNRSGRDRVQALTTRLSLVPASADGPTLGGSSRKKGRRIGLCPGRGVVIRCCIIFIVRVHSPRRRFPSRFRQLTSVETFDEIETFKELENSTRYRMRHLHGASEF